jgi:hypothetical protein
MCWLSCMGLISGEGLPCFQRVENTAAVLRMWQVAPSQQLPGSCCKPVYRYRYVCLPRQLRTVL